MPVPRTQSPSDTSQEAARLVTPALLTFNEAPNLERALRSLEWASRVVIVDSGSTDATEAIARRFPNVDWQVRRFDTHAAQWRFAIAATSGTTPYTLALDADYSVPPEFVAEMSEHFSNDRYAGGIAGFEYRINGRPLSGSVYPPKLVLFRPGEVEVTQPGHSQELAVEGPTYRFASRLIHDDRKPLERFVSSQLAYARLEAGRLSQGQPLRWQDRLRRAGVMPLVSGLGAYVRAGGPFSGRAALRYAYERVVFECLLAMRVLERNTQSDEAAAPVARPPHGDPGTG